MAAPIDPRETQNHDEDFRDFADRGDVEALARLFDVAAPRLLLLAGHLAPPGVEAEDLVQQTFYEAITGRYEPREGTTVLAWLAAILRNRAVDAARHRERRRETSLDERFDRPSGERAPEDSLADEETFELVVAAIDTLEAPQREVLSLRLVHGLAPVEIAHTLGREPATVRSQLKRGLERLREALPVGITGALAAVLLNDRSLAQVRDEVLDEARRLANSPSTTEDGSSVAGYSASSILLHPGLLVLVLVLAATFAIGLLAPRETSPSRAPLPSLSSAELDTPPTARLDLQDAAPGDTRRALVEADATRVADEDREAVGVPTVTGRVVDHAGLAIGGASVSWKVSRSGDSSFAIDEREGEPTTTRADGSFTVAVDTTLLGSEPFEWVQLTIEPPAHPHPSFRLPADAFDPSVDLGTIELPRLVPVTLSATTPSGAPIAWLEGAGALGFTSWQPASDYASKRTRMPLGRFDVDGRTPTFDVPEGRLMATISYLTGQVESEFIVAADSPNDFTLIIDGPDPATTVVVSHRNDLLAEVLDVPLERHATLILEDGSLRTDAVQFDDFRIGFDDVPDGDHRIELMPPGLEPVTLENVRAGLWRNVVLRGACAVHLRVFDSDGTRITDYALGIGGIARSLGSLLPPKFRSRAQDRADHEYYESVVATDQTWTVTLPDGRAASVEIEDLVPGETRVVTVEVAPATLLRGVVLDHTGTPAAGVAFEVRRRSRFGSNFGPVDGIPTVPEGESAVVDAKGSSVGRTDSEGRFAVPIDPESGYDVLVARSHWCYVLAEEVEHDDEVVIRLPATRSVSGRVEGPSPEVLQHLHLVARSDAIEALGSLLLPEEGAVAIGADGSFRFEDLPNAPCEFSVLYPNEPSGSEIPNQSSRRFTSRSLVPIGSVGAGEEPVADLILDAHAARPATARIEVWVDGTPAQTCSVIGIRQDSSSARFHGSFARPIGLGSALNHDWLEPGTWLFGVRSDSDPWVFMETDPRQVAPGEELVIEFDVPTVPGSVRFVDPDGKPLAETDLLLALDVAATDIPNREVFGSGVLDPKLRATTDADGRAEFSLLPGRIFVRVRPPGKPFAGFRGDAHRTIVWTADGPLEDSVTLERPD